MASMFSDDAYNKDIDHEGPGTLIGNWWEEQGLRSAVGEGRCIPQRHLKRSGGLDFNKPANTGKREMDNTFERTQGQKSNHVAVPTSKQYGDGAHEAVNVPLPSQQKAPLEALLHKARMQQAADEVEEEDKLVEALNHERFFETTTGAVHTKPDETQAEKAVHVRTSAQSEVFCGPTANRSITLNNEGLNVPSHTHYSNVEGITHARMALADPKSAGDVSASMAGGMTLHGRHSGFTKPMQEFIDGCMKVKEDIKGIDMVALKAELKRIEGRVQPGALAVGERDDEGKVVAPRTVVARAERHREVEERVDGRPGDEIAHAEGPAHLLAAAVRRDVEGECDGVARSGGGVAVVGVGSVHRDKAGHLIQPGVAAQIRRGAEAGVEGR